MTPGLESLGAPATPAAAPPRHVVPLVAFLLFAGVSLALLCRIPWPSDLDELQHVSYVAALQEDPVGNLVAARRMTLDEHDLRRWTAEPNYVGHPPVFYLLLVPALDRDAPTGAAILALRLATWAMVALGVALSLAAGWRHFASRPRALLVCCALVALSPRIVVAAASISNDALALLAGAVAYAATTRPIGTRMARILLCAAVVLAWWAKPNAALLISVFAAVYALAAGMRLLHAAALVGAGVAIGFAASVPEFLASASLVPVTGEVQLGNRVYRVATLAMYVSAFVQHFGLSWSLKVPSLPGAFLLGWGIVLLAMVGAALALRRGREDARGAVALASAAALLVVLPVQFAYGAIALGYSIPATSFRYMLPLMPLLAHSVAYGVSAARGQPGQAVLAWSAMLVLLAGWSP